MWVTYSLFSCVMDLNKKNDWDLATVSEKYECDIDSKAVDNNFIIIIMLNNLLMQSFVVVLNHSGFG